MSNMYFVSLCCGALQLRTLFAPCTIQRTEEKENIMNTFEMSNPELAGRGMTFDITPHPSLLPKTGQVGYSIEEAVAELVDNSIDACLLDTVKVTIMLNGIGDDKDSQSFEIEDDGKGMTLQEANNAVVLGLSNKNKDAIGAFGMGLKTACTFLGGRFVVETATQDDPDATLVVYDDEEFRGLGKWELTAYRKPKRFSHGTHIRIEKMNVNLTGRGRGAAEGKKPIDRLRKLLSRQHRLRLNSGDVQIRVNDLTVTAHTPDYDPQWQPVFTPFDFKTESGKRVHGHIGIAKNMKGKGEEFGLDLIRNGRIVKEYEKLGVITSHPSWRNVYGVVFLDDFPVTSNKSDFVRDSDEWLELEMKVAAITRPLGTAKSKWFEIDGPSAKANKDKQHLYQLVREMVDDREVIKWVLPQAKLVEVPDDIEDDDENEGDLAPEAPFGGFGQSHNGNGTAHGTGTDADAAETQDNDSGFRGGSVTGAGGTLNTGLPPTDISRRTAPEINSSIFDGTVAGFRFTHRAAHNGMSAGNSTSDFTWQSVQQDGETVLEVVSNWDYHTSPEVQTRFWFSRNVAAAAVACLINTGELECIESDGLASALLLDLLA